MELLSSEADVLAIFKHRNQAGPGDAEVLVKRLGFCLSDLPSKDTVPSARAALCADQHLRLELGAHGLGEPVHEKIGLLFLAAAAPGPHDGLLRDHPAEAALHQGAGRLGALAAQLLLVEQEQVLQEQLVQAPLVRVRAEHGHLLDQELAAVASWQSRCGGCRCGLSTA